MYFFFAVCAYFIELFHVLEELEGELERIRRSGTVPTWCWALVEHQAYAAWTRLQENTLLNLHHQMQNIEFLFQISFGFFFFF